MAPSPLLVRPAAPDADGRIHAVTPASAGWSYVGFEVYDLAPGGRIARATGGTEACGGEGPGWSLYVPARSSFAITAEGGTCEVAVCTAPAEDGKRAARL